MPGQTIINDVITKLIDWGRTLYLKNYVAAFDGNLSYKLSEDLILITKSGCMKGFLKPEDFVIISNKEDLLQTWSLDSKGQPLNPTSDLKASSESIMHLEIYNNQPKAKSVFHAHPPTATAFSIAYPDHKSFPLNFISELILALGEVPIVSYQRPGTAQMGNALVPYLAKAKVMILQFHGVVSWGEDIEEAYRGIERIEHAAEVYLKAKMFGYVGSLPQEEIEVLKDMRMSLGFKSL